MYQSKKTRNRSFPSKRRGKETPLTLPSLEKGRKRGADQTNRKTRKNTKRVKKEGHMKGKGRS